MAKKHPRDSFSTRLALKIITFSLSRPVSKLHSPINTHMGSRRLNTHASRLNHGNSSLFREGKLLQEILCPSFWQKHILSLDGSAMLFFPLSLPYAAGFMKVSKWAISWLEGNKKNGLSCLNQHHLILCLCPTYPPLSRIALHCALAPCCSGEGDSFLPAAEKRWPLPPYFPPYRERSLSMKATVASRYISWLKLVSGTVNKAVPTSARQAIACTARKDFCKTSAYVCIKSLCWSDSTTGSAFQKQCVYTFTREQTLFTESHTQMYKAEHGWEVFRSA